MAIDSGVNFNIDPSSPLPVFDNLANHILNNIYEHLNKKSKEYSDINKSAKNYYDSSLNNQASEQRFFAYQSKAAASNDRAVQKALSGITNNQKKNMASEANNRAIDKALSGRQNRDGLNALKDFKDTMKSCFDTLKGALLGVLNDTLKTQTQYAKLMRQNFLTKEEKDRSQIMANAAQGQVESLLGFKLEKSEIVEYYNALQAGGHDLEAMGEEQRAKYAALRKSGLDDAEAYKYAMEASTAAVKQITTAATDPRTRQLIKQQLATVSESERATVGVDKVISQIAQSSANTAKYAGGAITDFDKMSESLANNRRAANGMTEEVDGAMLAIQGGIKTIGSEGNALVENANRYSVQELRALASSGDEATRQMANQMLTIKNMQANSQNVGTNLRTRAQNEKALSDNASNGKVIFEIQKAFGELDNSIFGGAIGKFSNTFDELFGDSADIGRLVSTGFKVVSTLLKSIYLNTNGVAKWLIGGLGAAGAIVAIVANWDKIKPKLGEIFDKIKPVLEKVVQNIPSFIKDIVSGVGNLLPEVWNGLKKSFSGLFSGDGLLGKTGSSIGESIKDLAPTFKGFFDGLGGAIADAIPGISDIVLKVTEVIGKLVDIVAPAVPAIVRVLQTVADAITPIISAVKEIVVTTVDSIRKVIIALTEPIRLIAESINVLAKSIAPIIPTIVSAIEFAVKQILPKALQLLDKVVVTILPPILDIARKIVESLLPPIVETFTKLVDVILPPVSEVLNTIALTVDKVVNLIIDVIEPPLLAVSSIITNVLSTLDNAVKFVNDIVLTINGMYNYFVNKIPTVIGWLSGTINYLQSAIGPLVRSGFKVVKDVILSAISTVKELITITLGAPIVTLVNAVQMGFKFLQYKLSGVFDKDESKLAEFEEAQRRLLGNKEDRAAQQAYEDAKKAFNSATDEKSRQDALEILKSAANNYLSESEAMVVMADAEKRLHYNNADDAISEFTKVLNSDVVQNGIKFDKAEADNAQSFLDLARNQQQVSVLPPNTGSLLDTITQHVTKTSDTILKIHEFLTKLNTYAGGASSTHGPGIVGEAGREAIIPLDKPSVLKNLINKMSSTDKSKIRTAVNDSLSSSGNSIADNAIAYARDQLGKPYSIYSDGFVCNTLVQSAFRSAGMKKFPSGTVSTHWNSSKLHRVNLSDVLPGMIGFSNKSDKTGFPQHMGIITTNGKWINASGSSDSYAKGKFKAKEGSKGVIEVPMNNKAKWGMVGAGFYDGMFDAATSKYIATKQTDTPDGIITYSGNSVLPQDVDTAVKELTPEEYSQLYSNLAEGTDVVAEGVKAKTDTQLETLQNLSKNAINTIIAQTNGQVKYDVSNSKSAKKVSDSSSQRDEIVLAMKDVVKYLRDMATFVKKPAGASAPARLPHA
jgi:cell wall-associated NlpC family hydrolase/phage-related protein